MTTITHPKEGITGLPVPLPQARATVQWRLDAENEKARSSDRAFVFILACNAVANVQIAHSKKAFPIGKAFYLVAERTGLEPATPGVTGRYS
ncbi:hypothetical protein, partial [Aeromonas sp. SG16]|uniref:hypothetical protein n=1 Tax=Aeromonas sp. SG16 TaxID=2950548 RepID=UPI00210E32AD